MPDLGSTITLTEAERVATITISHPEQPNPLSRANYRDLAAKLEDAAEGDARCVVLEGAGDAFTAGGDVGMLQEHLDDLPPAPDRERAVRANEHATIRRLVEYPLPTVAKVDGPALGDGANLAIACDVPLASERARFGFSHVRFGLSMDTGGSYLLPRAVGRSMAKELAYTGRVLDAEAAHELGLVNHVYPVESFEDRADDLVGRIADGPPLALERLGAQMEHGATRSIAEALDHEAEGIVATTGSRDHAEGVRAFLEDRDPEFTGR